MTAHVQFSIEAIEDREASIAADALVMKDVHVAKITADKNTAIEHQLAVVRPQPDGQPPVVEELSALKRWRGAASRARGPRATPRDEDEVKWLACYEAWLEGNEEPEFGFALKNWPHITPAMVKNCIRAGVRTVEELAEANESTLGQIGMGSVALKQKAQAYLAAGGTGAEKIAALETEAKAKDETISQQSEAIAELQRRLDALEGPQPKAGSRRNKKDMEDAA